MPRTPFSIARRIKSIIHHVVPLPSEARSPILHYKQTSSAINRHLVYTRKALHEFDSDARRVKEHLTRLNGMAPSFPSSRTWERFFKEIAAQCVDYLAPYIVDERFDIFKIQGSALASHFATDTLGKSLCESATWLDCEEINDRFRKLLADPYQTGGQFYLFPKPNQQPIAEQWRYETMSIVWQLRHSAVHNVGVVTQSDAVRLRLLAREPVEGPRLLSPSQNDLIYLKRFLDETASACNDRVGVRLAELLTILHAETPSLFGAQGMADSVTECFRIPVQIAGTSGVMPPD